MSTFDHYKTWAAAIGALLAGTVLCWFGKISGAEWVATLALFVPLIGKDAVVQVKAMNIAAATP